MAASAGWLKKLILDTQFYEILGILSSLILSGTIVGLLANFDSQVIPDLAHEVTVNAIVAFLAVTARASLLTSVASDLLVS